MKQKLFTFFLALVASVGTMLASTKIGDLYYNLNASNKTAEVTYHEYNTSSNYSYLTNVAIPSNIEYESVTYAVTSIGKEAFYDCHSLTSITIPNSVTNIGYLAFTGTGLSSIVVENGNTIYDSRENCNAIIKTAEDALIFGCKNTIIPNSVVGIGYDAFEDCEGLTSITIPNSVTYIGESAFRNCHDLTSITIPNSVTSIGNLAFSGTGLTSIVVEKGNTIYDSRENCNAIIKASTNTLIAGCKNTIIPNDVTSIGNYAFYQCAGLTSVTIPNSVTSIGETAFSGCTGLTSVIIPNSVTSIGNSAFAYCTGLTSVTIGNSVTSIGDYAFYGCSGLTSVTIGNSVTSIGNDAFSNTGLTSVTLNSNALVNKAYTSSSNLKNIFGGQVTEYFIGDNVSGIGENAFYGCSKLSSVTIGNSVTSIGNSAFGSCKKLTSITIPNSVTEIGGGAFCECTGLTSVTIPNSVTSIGGSAFYGCTGLTSVAIGNRVKCIGYGAFSGCSNLTSVHISDLAAWCNITFLSKVDEYYSNPLENAHHLYLNGTEIKDLIIPNSITSIGNDAFVGCTGLTSVTIPNSVTSIGYWAFFDCIGLSSVTIGKNVTYIGEQAFAYCTGLTSVTCFATTPPDIEFDVFQEIDCSQIPLYVPSESINAYKNAYTWEDFSKIRAIGDAYYIVTFKDWDGTVLKIEEVEQGQSATAPTDPTRENYTFIGWDKEFSNVQSDLIVTAQYTINIHTISTAVNDEARGTVTGDQKAEHLTAVELTATANYGYHFEYWESDGKQYTSNPLTVTATDNALYTAYFFPNTYNLNVYSENSSMGAVSAPQQAEYLDVVTITANAANNFHFVQWNDGNTDNPRTIVVSRDTTFVAEFDYDRTGTCGKDLALVWTYDPIKKVLTISNAGAFTENMHYGVEAPKEMQDSDWRRRYMHRSGGFQGLFQPTKSDDRQQRNKHWKFCFLRLFQLVICNIKFQCACKQRIYK